MIQSGTKISVHVRNEVEKEFGSQLPFPHNRKDDDKAYYIGLLPYKGEELHWVNLNNGRIAAYHYTEIEDFKRLNKE